MKTIIRSESTCVTNDACATYDFFFFQELNQISVSYNERKYRDAMTTERSRDVKKIYSLDAKVGISIKEV
ncbi:hypothetical protein HanIR_Chr12g0592531 [Helianthus annuus]|nr:hypothetical protein HanIR_Chr12g0592531 [Helianthus annuus]